MINWIKSIFGWKKPNAWVVLLFDGHLHYWCGNVFTTKDNAKRWAKEFSKNSESIKVRDIVGVNTKDIFYFVNLELNPEMKKYAEAVEKEIVAGKQAGTDC